MEMIKRLRLLARMLLTRIELHGELMKVEWIEEKRRLKQMLVVSLLGFVFLLCALFFLGIFAIVIAWPTDYRIHTAGAVLVLYGLATALCAFRLNKLSELSAATFAVTREEVAADLALLRSRV